jgi:hypothetical protein
MTEFIYQRTGGHEWTRLAARPFARETELQELLLRCPQLLPGDQIDPDSPRRWIVVDREALLRHEEAQAPSWYADHLLLDQDGIPTLVETKLASNRELRRSVVGQLLDYASSLLSSWTAERMRERFTENCHRSGTNEESALLDLLGSEERAVGEDFDLEEAIDAYWSNVEEQLTSGRLRLLIVADRIPSPLLRVVEFLNRQMEPCEVLAVELRQFVDDASEPPLQTLVPRVLGHVAKKPSAPRSGRLPPGSPGDFILAGVAATVLRERGLDCAIDMHRRGWLRFHDPRGQEDREWLLYQNKTKGTVHVYFDPRHPPLEDSERQQIKAALQSRWAAQGLSVVDGIDRENTPFVQVAIPGYRHDDSSNWPQLRQQLLEVLEHFLEVTAGWARSSESG